MRFKVGESVIIRWIDSAIGGEGQPGKHDIRLKVGETHGKVIRVSRDDSIHRKACRKGCRCSYVELAMCSGGEDDHRSDLALIWIPSIISVRRMVE